MHAVGPSYHGAVRLSVLWDHDVGAAVLWIMNGGLPGYEI